MTNQEILDTIATYVEDNQGNFVSEEDAISPGLAGLRIYEQALVGFADARDSLFTEEFKKTEVIDPGYRSPEEWLPGAKTVISFFLPFTQEVKRSNLKAFDEPYEEGIPQRCSQEWLHGRIEGQLFVNDLCGHLLKVVKDRGYQAVCPSISGEFRMVRPYVSVWSERHAAYAAGLGTFGLSKGLITEKGIAGRFGSVITDACFNITPRPYSSPFEYCIMCGACMRRCPPGAIDITKGCALGKDQTICGPYVKGSYLPPQGQKQRVRYGCGKCQVGVPCENGLPVQLRDSR